MGLGYECPRLPTPRPECHSISSASATIIVDRDAPADLHWYDNAFFRNADWPALLLNLVVLGLAIFGVLQAIEANRTAQKNERRAFRAGRFKPLSQTLERHGADLMAASELFTEACDPSVQLNDFDSQIDSLGKLLFHPKLKYIQKLKAIDHEGVYGSEWVKTFDHYSQRIEGDYDIANDQGRTLPDRRNAAQCVANDIKEGIEAVGLYEFDQFQGWGKPPA